MRTPEQKEAEEKAIKFIESSKNIKMEVRGDDWSVWDAQFKDFYVEVKLRYNKYVEWMIDKKKIDSLDALDKPYVIAIVYQDDIYLIHSRNIKKKELKKDNKKRNYEYKSEKTKETPVVYIPHKNMRKYKLV
jgi:hypothetical protein